MPGTDTDGPAAGAERRTVRASSGQAGRWAVYLPGSSRACRLLNTRGDAVAVAKRALRRRGGVVDVLDDAGRLVERHQVQAMSPGRRRGVPSLRIGR